MLHVTKSFLPELKEYTAYLERIWESTHLTNDGPLLLELEEKLKNYLGVEHFIFVANGTIALQLALKALEVEGEVITTPFSYCATTNALLWENCIPVFADINKTSLTVESFEIREKINSKTKAILTTHVYGNCGDLEEQINVANQFDIPLIFDGAHAFGVQYKGQSIYNFGTISTCSFHATKIFHTIEGGAVMTNDAKLASKVRELRSFGHRGDAYFSAGINGKNSEFHAAMGLVNLIHFPDILAHRKWACTLYEDQISNKSSFVKWNSNVERNYSYFPLIFKNEHELLQVTEALAGYQIYPRRYFYPSLNEMPFIKGQSCPISEDIANRIICLPLSASINEEEIRLVCDVINQHIA